MDGTGARRYLGAAGERGEHGLIADRIHELEALGGSPPLEPRRGPRLVTCLKCGRRPAGRRVRRPCKCSRPLLHES